MLSVRIEMKILNFQPSCRGDRRSIFRRTIRLTMFIVAGTLLLRPWASAASVDASTLDGKMISGYQGWFACPRDSPWHSWVHWKDAHQSATVDLLPDVSELDGSELCDSGWTAKNGKPVELFSSQNSQTVDRHFAWMENYGLDGIALQKFATTLLHSETNKVSDTVLANVRAGAEKHGRVYFLMYDLSGMPTDALALVVEDWRRLLSGGITDDHGYLRHRGHPILGVWGIGFADRDLSPEIVDVFLKELRRVSAIRGGVTLLGGVPAGWRKGEGDASANSGWSRIWPELDVISPWTVGRYHDDDSADKYRDDTLKPDFAFSQSLGLDYMPVVFPGFTWSNLMRARQQDARAIPDQIPRRCGAFYSHQLSNAVSSGAKMLYTAMFDELDEGTAIFKVATDPDKLPSYPSFVLPDVNGCRNESDMYLKLAGRVDQMLHRTK